MLPPRPSERPNERRKLTFRLDEKPGDPHGLRVPSGTGGDTGGEGVSDPQLQNVKGVRTANVRTNNGRFGPFMMRTKCGHSVRTLESVCSFKKAKDGCSASLRTALGLVFSGYTLTQRPAAGRKPTAPYEVLPAAPPKKRIETMAKVLRTAAIVVGAVASVCSGSGAAEGAGLLGAGLTAAGASAATTARLAN